jgi:hypothetical protein
MISILLLTRAAASSLAMDWCMGLLQLSVGHAVTFKTCRVAVGCSAPEGDVCVCVCMYVCVCVCAAADWQLLVGES